MDPLVNIANTSQLFRVLIPVSIKSGSSVLIPFMLDGYNLTPALIPKQNVIILY